MLKRLIHLRINGEVHDVVIEPYSTLLEVLREELDLTGTKEACDTGSCGACTVIQDAKAILACLMLAVDSQGKDILTIEGLSRNGQLHPLQREYINRDAVQCGFCNPGILLAAKALLDEQPTPTEDDVKRAIGGNLCRCTGYAKVCEAIMAAIKQMAR